MTTPNPGTQAARDAGCICPWEQPLAFQGLYWHNGGCPVHREPWVPVTENEIEREQR